MPMYAFYERNGSIVNEDGTVYSGIKLPLATVDKLICDAFELPANSEFRRANHFLGPQSAVMEMLIIVGLTCTSNGTFDYSKMERAISDTDLGDIFAMDKVLSLGKRFLCEEYIFQSWA